MSAGVAVLSVLAVLLTVALITFIVLYIKKPTPPCDNPECDTSVVCTREVCNTLYPTNPTECNYVPVTDVPFVDKALALWNGYYLNVYLDLPYQYPDQTWTHQGSKLTTLFQGEQYALSYSGSYPNGKLQTGVLKNVSNEDWIYDSYNFYLKGPVGDYEFGKSPYALMLTPIVTPGTSGILLTLTPVNLCNVGRSIVQNVISVL